jgi:hypothetical protein
MLVATRAGDVWGARSEELQDYRAPTTVGPSTTYITLGCSTFESCYLCVSTLPKRYLHLYITPRPVLWKSAEVQKWSESPSRQADSPPKHPTKSELLQDYLYMHASSLLTHLSQSQRFHPAATSDSGQRVANDTTEQHIKT